jgi:FMN phosphatase YigB (HAD superfamily)
MALRNVKLILVDGDDTLWADRIYFTALYREAKTIIGNSRALRDGVARCGPGESGFVDAISEVASRIILNDAKRRELRDAIERFLRHPIVVFPGARRELERMAESASIALYTKGVYAEQIRKLERSRFAELFASVFIVKEKNEETLRAILENWRCEGRDTLVIGNNIGDDVVPALKVGAQCVWFNHPGNPYGRHNHTIPDLREVASWEGLYEALS